jgi:hypothetical protein
VIDRTNEAPQRTQPLTTEVPSELRQWPVKLYLVNPNAPYFRDADLLVAADCVPFALGSFHPELLRGRILVTGCPKFDETSVYLEKLTEIFAQNDIRTVTVAMMEVPCCSGMLRLVHSAVEASGKNVPVESVVVGLDGQAISRTRFA